LIRFDRWLMIYECLTYSWEILSVLNTLWTRDPFRLLLIKASLISAIYLA
jgi:hypothetical protein